MSRISGGRKPLREPTDTKKSKPLPAWVKQAAGSVVVPKGRVPLGSRSPYSESNKNSGDVILSKRKKPKPNKEKNPLATPLPFAKKKKNLRGNAAALLGDKIKVSNPKYQKKINAVLGL